MTRLACLLVLVAGVARADVWKDALGNDLQRDNYNHQLKAGDDFVGQANAHQISRATAKALLKKAVEAYRLAAEAEPQEAEPYFRISETLYSFYFECRVGSFQTRISLCIPFDTARAEETLAAWEEAEKRAPLDPRYSIVWFADSLLFARALLHTHLATTAHLEAAARDYEKVLARSAATDLREPVLANLAETYMMLGRLDDAIEMYREAQPHSTTSSTAFGLAVALDRDERGAEAMDLIREQGLQARVEFHDSYLKGDTFFVPSGEEAYYFALLAEAWGENEQAIELWQRYIKSGAHPEFQPRAKKHIATLLAEHKSRPAPDPGPVFENPFTRP